MKELAAKITDSELEVMRALWQAGDALPVTEIRRQLQARTGWESTTIKTLVQRLLKKGVIAQEKRNVFYYAPLVSEREYNDWATGALVSKLYRGSAKALAAALVSSRDLTKEDVEELRAMFNGEDEK